MKASTLRRVRRRLRRLRESAGAGLLALSLVEDLERRLLGRAPLYSSGRIAARLARRAGLSVGPRGERALGTLLRWPYALALVAARELCMRAAPRGLARALSLGGAVYLFERLALPAARVAPPLEAWPRGDRWLLPVHVAAFALAAELAS